jgi:DNA-binding response OmpR family regulator
LRETISYNLVKDGYTVQAVSDRRAAVETALQLNPDPILLDLMLPKIDGLEVCRILRKKMVTPIIMLTARDDESDRVVGLEVGADDYLTKPFSMRELMARIKAQLRRSRLLRFPKFANLLYLLWIAG